MTHANATLRFNVGGYPGRGELRFSRAEIEARLEWETKNGAALLFGPPRAGKTTLLRGLQEKLLGEGWEVVWLDVRWYVGGATPDDQPGVSKPGAPAGDAHLQLLDAERVRALTGEAPSPTSLTRAIAATVAPLGGEARVAFLVDELNVLAGRDDRDAWLEALATPRALGADARLAPRAAYATNWPLPLPARLQGLFPIYLPRAVAVDAAGQAQLAQALVAARERVRTNAAAMGKPVPPALTEAQGQLLAQRLVAFTGASASFLQALGAKVAEGALDGTDDAALAALVREALGGSTGLVGTTERQLADLAPPSGALECLVWLDALAEGRRPPWADAPAARGGLGRAETKANERRDLLFALGWMDVQGGLAGPVVPFLYDATWRRRQLERLAEPRPTSTPLSYAPALAAWARTGALPPSDVGARQLEQLTKSTDPWPAEVLYREALVKAARAELRRTWARNLAIVSALFTLVVLAGSAFAAYGAQQRAEAVAERAEADRQRAEAGRQRAEADRQLQEARATANGQRLAEEQRAHQQTRAQLDGGLVRLTQEQQAHQQTRAQLDGGLVLLTQEQRDHDLTQQRLRTAEDNLDAVLDVLNAADLAAARTEVQRLSQANCSAGSGSGTPLCRALRRAEQLRTAEDNLDAEQQAHRRTHQQLQTTQANLDAASQRITAAQSAVTNAMSHHGNCPPTDGSRPDQPCSDLQAIQESLQ